MTNTKMLIGSLSNDLYRVASLASRGSYAGADRFYLEAQRWSAQLADSPLKTHISNIISEINADDRQNPISNEKAEKLLMYSILLQNYALHMS